MTTNSSLFYCFPTKKKFKTNFNLVRFFFHENLSDLRRLLELFYGRVVGQDYWDITKGTVGLRQDESRFVLKESNHGWRGSLPCGLMFYESNNDFLKFISLVMDVYCEKWFRLEKSDIYHLGHRVKDLMIDGILGLQWIYDIHQFWFPHRLRIFWCFTVCFSVDSCLYSHFC